MRAPTSLTVFLFILTTAPVSPSDLQSLDEGFEEVDEFSHESLNFFPSTNDLKNLSRGLWHSLDSAPPLVSTIQPVAATVNHPSQRRHHQRHQKPKTSIGHRNGKKNSQRGQRLKNNKHGNLFPYFCTLFKSKMRFLL